MEKQVSKESRYHLRLLKPLLSFRPSTENHPCKYTRRNLQCWLKLIDGDLKKSFSSRSFIKRRRSWHTQDAFGTQKHDFQALLSVLDMRFEKKCTKEFSLQQLKSHYQIKSKTLPELVIYVNRFCILAYPYYPADVDEDLALKYFIRIIMYEILKFNKH